MVDKRVEEQLHTSQMDESSVNLELVDYLKKNGMSFILMIVIIFACSKAWIYYTASKEAGINEAWADLAGASTVRGLLEIADNNDGTGSIAELALLKAAQMNYAEILQDKPLDDGFGELLDPASNSDATEETSDENPENDDAATNDTINEDDTNADAEGSEDANSNEDSAVTEVIDEPKPTSLSDADREELLAGMGDMYQRVLDSTTGDSAKTVLRLRALFGMAMVSEMQSDFEAADNWYSEIIDTATGRYDPLVDLAIEWRDTARTEAVHHKLPTAEEVAAMRTKEIANPVGSANQNIPMLDLPLDTEDETPSSDDETVEPESDDVTESPADTDG